MAFIRCISSRVKALGLVLSLLIMPLAPARAGDLVEDSVRDFTTVMVIGAGGAILGLSTLSFVSEPKNHLRNILIGGAIGVIVGVGFVAYKQANTSKTIIESAQLDLDSLEYSTMARHQWHQQEGVERVFREAPLPQMSFQFSF